MADGPRPWFGCDKSGEAWRAYCEAWEHAFRDKRADARSMIADRRGASALAALEHNIRVVKRDYRGDIDDRSEIPKLLQL